jgi:hypothetical protein
MGAQIDKGTKQVQRCTARPFATLLPTAALTEIAACSAAVATIGWFLYLLLWSDAAWLHPEVLGSSAYIWIAPGQESLAAMLRKIFDWQAFDPNVNRVRPLNDAFEVIDAIARPYITLLVGIQASLNISTVLTAVAAPLLLFSWFRRIFAAWAPALILTLVFISSTAFLSLTVAYLHPAKKLNLIFLCAALYFAERMRNGEKGWNAAWLALSLLGSFFSDELGLGNFVVIGIIYWRELLADWRRVALFVALPVLFVVATKWGLPALYLRFSVHGPWDAFNDHKKLAVFAYLLDSEFYRDCAEQLSRSILSTVGISLHTGATAIATLIVLIGVPAVHVIRSRQYGIAALLRDRLVLATIALVLLNGYATLLDWYPFPHEISYLGSFNYYYHSPVAVVVLVWLAFALLAFRLDRAPAVMLVVVAALVVVSNFVIFRNVNELVKIIHYYPRSRDTIFSALQKGTLDGVTPDRANQDVAFEAAAKVVFGDRWQQNGFYQIHKSFSERDIFVMNEEHLKLLLHAYRPWSK